MQFKMNNRNDSERCMSTASTVSGIYSHLLPSPTPVCMFYFAHPFGGIATPSSTSYSIDPFTGMPSASEKTPNSIHTNGSRRSTQEQRPQQWHLNDFTPWPRQTWQSKDLLSPLIKALQKQIGQNINDFEKVLRTIRELFYSTQNNNIIDVQYLHNYYSFIQRQKQLNEQNFDFILNWQENLSPANCVHFIGLNAFTTDEMMMMMTDNNRKLERPLDGMATTTMHNKSKKPHTGLLRRRHSLPEIIMRRHQLATQKHVFSDMNVSSAPSPPARERIPPSFELRERTRMASPFSLLGSSSSTIIANGFGSAGSTGSDSNLNRIFPTNGSMRQQLLRRLWHKEYRRMDRTGSLSPPLHRSFRTKRIQKIQDTQPEVCSECERLDITHFNRSVPEIAMKHIKHKNSSISKSSSSTSSLAFPHKSYSIETETLNVSSVPSSEQKCPLPVQSDVSNTTATKELDISIAANMLNQINGNYGIEDKINGNAHQTNGENSFLIEMEDDQINITTMAAAESTAISDSTLLVSSNESTFRQLSESTISQMSTSNQWYHSNDSGNNNNNNNNNNSSNGENDSKSKLTEIGHMKGGTYEAYHMSSGEIDIENESVVRLRTHEPLDQSTIDTIISQILVDSLNNIIVVQGKGNQSDSNDDNIVELSTSQTQTNNTAAMMNENGSNSSALPLPVSDQVYFPHYLSNETLSEYSKKLSDHSIGSDLLPSNLVISVISGSSYPCNGGDMVVHRMTDMSRTESMEVQPSSAPSLNADDENGNRIPERPTKILTTADEDDDATSLVDSLDDPNAVSNVSDLDAAHNNSKVMEKSQAFFVAIENSNASSEIVSTPADLNAPIAETMPDRLRERLQKRQMEIVERKEAENKRRQEKIQKLINQNCKSKSSSDSKSFGIIPDESQKILKKSIKPVVKKSKQLQMEIGSLESYTVDAQGNLKFIEAGKKANGAKKIRTISGPVVKHVTVKKTITTSKPLITKKPRESGASDKSATEKRIKVTSNTTKYQTKDIANQKMSKDVQKMILVDQHSPSDIITPDRDCGPRRMYQKTEIQEGAKRIEILEIVECLNSSPDIMNPSQSSSSSPPIDSTQSQSLIERFSAKHSSKIPVPVLPKSKSRRTQQRTLKAQIRSDSVSHYNGTTLNNTKVDQIIADLLIEALNHSTNIGIEFIKTPQTAPAQSHTKVNSGKRMNLIHARRSNGLTAGGSGGMRSAHSSGKYQHVFDSIPEEKSGSLSIESPNDENNTSSPSQPPDDRTNTNSIANPASESESKITTKTTPSSSPKRNETGKRSSPKTKPKHTSKIANGKAAIESDQIKSEAWFGCFGRTHVDSPVDGLLTDEATTEKQAETQTVNENANVPLTVAQTQSYTVASTAISSVDTKSSVVTSIPSEAPFREIESVGSDSILPLIEETFENSITANHGGDAAKDKPYRKHARCSAQNHFDAACSECETIENNLKQSNDSTKKNAESNLNGNDKKLHLVAIKPSCNSNSNENVWQVAHIDKYDTMGKFMLSPLTVWSAQGTRTLTNNSSIKFGVDSNSSFIVLHDENDNASHFLPNITSDDQLKNQNTFDRPCDDCCFCNPSLHHKRRNDTENSPKKCNFCSSRIQSTQTTPVTTTRYEEKGQSINNNNTHATTRSSAAPIERIYESKYRSNHTHIQTHSIESDTINTQCTKKTNKKVRKMLSSSEDGLNANNDSTRNKIDDQNENGNGNEVNGNKTTKYKSSIPKLPLTKTDWITNSMESATSPSSSYSTGSSTKSTRRQDSKSVPNLPRTEYWQNPDSSPNIKIQKLRTNSRYQNFYGNGTVSATDERTAVVTTNDPKSKATGWTVTVAGTYSDDMAPDVQMHLSFPKKGAIANPRKKFDKSTYIHRSIEQTKDPTEPELDTNSNYNDIDIQTPDIKPAILPPPPPPTSQSNKFNPKRSLTKNYLNNDLMPQQQQHSQLIPNRKFSFDPNGNANIYQRSAKDYCNLPHINNRDHANRIISKQTAKKTIKHSEYSVSVASATTTTRTISNFANGKRAMSIQALNANPFQRLPNSNNNSRRSLYGRRDHSADAAQLTYRLSATPSSPLPSSSFYSPTIIGCDDEIDRNGNNSRTNLSVLGNAKHYFRKPPVPTMSERDVTKRHEACFTRTRSIFL